MRTALEVRREVESALAERIPAALSVPRRQRPALVTTGVSEIDAVLGGGFPLGGLAEIAGSISSGRTTLAYSTLAGITQQCGVCAYVDVSDAFDPFSAASLGIDLSRLLWVRAGNSPAAQKHSGATVPHVPPIRKAERLTWDKKLAQEKPWSRLDQALRATDLLLSTGGFQAIVLDMGDVRPEHARRVPLATWYRFRLQVEKAQALFLLLTQSACANSCASVVLYCEKTEAVWRRASETSVPLLSGFRYCMNVERSRMASPELSHWKKKPPSAARAAWTSTGLWASCGAK